MNWKPKESTTKQVGEVDRGLSRLLLDWGVESHSIGATTAQGAARKGLIGLEAIVSATRLPAASTTIEKNN